MKVYWSIEEKLCRTWCYLRDVKTRAEGLRQIEAHMGNPPVRLVRYDGEKITVVIIRGGNGGRCGGAKNRRDGEHGGRSGEGGKADGNTAL